MMIIEHAPIIQPEPGSAEDISEKLQAGMRSVEASLIASVHSALRLEAQRCCEDVCQHCRKCAHGLMTAALYNEDARTFYHFDIADTTRIIAVCSAVSIWTRLRQQELLEKWKRERQFHQPWDGLGGGLIPQVYGQPDFRCPAQPDGSIVREFHIDNSGMSETIVAGKYCDTCAGTGWCKTMKDTVCNMCGGTGKR